VDGSDPYPHLRCDRLPANSLFAQLGNPLRIQDSSRTSECLAASPGGRQSGTNAAADKLSLKLSDRGEDAKHQSAIGGRSVHTLMERDKVDPESVELTQRIHQLP